jgi:hypothetical protein
MNIAQDVSRDEVQDILSKILQGEVKRPETYSLRLLEIVKNLTQKEVQSFCKFVALSDIHGFYTM